MIDRETVARLEGLVGNLDGTYSELREMARKKPNDGLNKFKIGIVNALVGRLNALLGKKYTPLEGFKGFSEDDVPTNSDVTLILAQYVEQLERYRADNLKMSSGRWIYDVQDRGAELRAAPPAKLTKK